MKRLILWALCLAFPALSWASHLVGGSIRYEFIRVNANGSHAYKIELIQYVDCGDNSNYQDPDDLDPYASLGIYYETKNTWNDIRLLRTLTLPKTDVSFISPSLPDNCNAGKNQCLMQAIYETEVNLTPNGNGFHLYHTRCCRNVAILNLKSADEQGTSFYAKIPPLELQNSSPEFLTPPIPFFCQGETVKLINNAIDKDGDRLEYLLMTPYAGHSTLFDPSPQYETVLEWPIRETVFESGYSASNPFGNSSTVDLDRNTGTTEINALLTGRFSMTIQVNEYRNNELIGVTRRDMHVLVIACEENDPPSSDDVSDYMEFNLTEGEDFCFVANFVDQEKENISLEMTGDLFNKISYAPTFQQTTVGDTTKGTFCWKPPCNSSQQAPFYLKLTATDDACPPRFKESIIRINVPAADIPDEIFGDTEICQGNSATYQISQLASSTANWTISGGTIDEIIGDTSVVVTWTQAGTGTLSVEVEPYGNCTSSTVSLDVSVKPYPNFELGNPEEICPGVAFELPLIGFTIDQASWSEPNNVEYDTDDNSVTFSNTSNLPIQIDWYVTTESNGCYYSDTLVFTVFPQPLPEAGADVQYCSGDTATIGYLPGGNSYVYEWVPKFGVESPFSAQSQVSTINATYPIDTLDYTLFAKDLVTGCIGSDQMTVITIPYPSPAAGADFTICSDEETILGDSPLDQHIYLWQPMELVDSPDDLNTGFSYNNSGNDNDTVQLYLNEAYYGCRMTDTLNIVVLPSPTLNTSNDTTVCAEDTISLSATGNGNIRWTNTDDLEIGTGTSLNYTANDSTWIYVTLTDSLGCITQNSIRISARPLPSVDAGPDRYLCPGDTLSLSGSGALNYSWSPADSVLSPLQASTQLALLTPNHLVLSGTDTHGCSAEDSVFINVHITVPTFAGPDRSICQGAEITLGSTPTAPTGSVYSWYNQDTTFTSADANPTLTLSTPDIFFVETTNDTCKGKDTLVIGIHPLPNVRINGTSFSACPDDTVSLSGQGAINYRWQAGSDTASGTNYEHVLTESILIKLWGEDQNGCINEDSITLQTFPVPDVEITADTQRICQGDTLDLLATGAQYYQWTGRDIILDNTDAPQVYPNQDQTYVATGINQHGCLGTDSIRITVIESPSLDIPEDTIVCEGYPTELNLPNQYTYTWKPGIITRAGRLLTIPVGTDEATLWARSENGCETLFPIQITRIPEPLSSFEYDFMPGCEQLLISGVKSSLTNDDYRWYVNNQLSSEESWIDVGVNYSSIARIRLLADNGYCHTESTQIIVVAEENEYKLISPPEIITPDQNGTNDYFTVSTNGQFDHCISIRIYNRWGKLVFEEMEYQNDWEGTHPRTKEVLSQGTYFYIIDVGGKEIKGNFMILY